jgi:hypothetical protein
MRRAAVHEKIQANSREIRIVLFHKAYDYASFQMDIKWKSGRGKFSVVISVVLSHQHHHLPSVLVF